MTDKIRTLGPGSLLIGETSSATKFDVDCISAALTPKSDTDDTDNFLDGHSESGAQTTDWTLDFTVKEDYTIDGIQAFCFNNAGTTLPFEFVPNTAGTIKFTGDVLVAPLGFGGDVKKKNEQDGSFAATNIKMTDSTSTSEG